MTRIYKPVATRKIVVVATAFALAALSGCGAENGADKHAAGGGVWEATLYAPDGGAMEMLGPFASREECTQASMQHLGADDRHAQAMAFGCAMMMK